MNFEELLTPLGSVPPGDNRPDFIEDREMAHSDVLENVKEYEIEPPIEVYDYEDANLVGSLVSWDKLESVHKPVIDIDFPAHLEPSSTPGHFHLYLQKEIPWSKYVLLLTAMAGAGILEEGYVAAAIRQGQTYVRRPGVKKGE